MTLLFDKKGYSSKIDYTQNKPSYMLPKTKLMIDIVINNLLISFKNFLSLSKISILLIISTLYRAIYIYIRYY